MTQILDDGERWVKSGLLGHGIEAHYDIDRMTPTSHGPVIAQVLVSHVTEDARRTASARADLICSIPELIRRAEAAEARSAQLEAQLTGAATVVVTLTTERDELRRQLEQALERIAESEATLKDIATSPYENQPNDGDEWEKEYYLRGMHR